MLPAFAFTYILLSALQTHTGSLLLDVGVIMLAVSTGSILAGRLSVRSLTESRVLEGRLLVEEMVKDIAKQGGLYAPTVQVRDTTTLIAAGRGRPAKPTIILSSGLISKLNREELHAVIAHEMAHMKLRHSAKWFGFCLLAIVLGLGVGTAASTVVDWPPGIARVLVGLTVSSLPLVVLAASLAWRRKSEHHADQIALELGARKTALVSALRKIEGSTCSGGLARWIPTLPDRGVAMAFREHPSVAMRIKALDGSDERQA